MLKKSLNLLLVGVLFCSFLFAQTDARLKGLDQEMNAVLEATKAAGFAVAVVEKDKVIYADGFGYRDVEQQLKADKNTQFAIGSSTKAFTAALLGILESEDKLSMEDSPNKYIPELNFFEPEMNNSIQIRDVLSHTTGLPRHDFSWYFFPSHSKDSLIQRVQYHEASSGIREDWQYNNFMYLSAGVITERITGASWEDNIKQHFFEPLGMTNSSADISGLKEGANAAKGYENDEDDQLELLPYYDIAGMSPAGSINSSVSEMSNWLKLWLADGTYDEKKLLPKRYIAAATSSQSIVTGRKPSEDHPDVHFLNYGYGWFLSSYKGHYRVEHGGNIDGFSANVAFFPSDSIGIVVLCNQDGSSLPRLVREIIADKLLNVEASDWLEEYKTATAEAKANIDEAEETTEKKEENTATALLRPIADYVGSFEHKGYGTINITTKQDSLFTSINKQVYYLQHVHFDVFKLLEVTDKGIEDSEREVFRLNFISNVNGEIEGCGAKLEARLDPIVFDRVIKTITLASNTLEQYVADYTLMGMVIKVSIKEDDMLYLTVPGQPDYLLEAFDNHKFKFKDIEGFKVYFKTNDAGEINALDLIQSNGTFEAVRKKE